jgi:hypothetical protein
MEGGKASGVAVMVKRWQAGGRDEVRSGSDEA